MRFLSLFVILFSLALGNSVSQTQPQTELIRAAQAGDTATINSLIRSGTDLNARDIHWGGRTALIIAADFGRTAAAEALIKAGADVNVADNLGRTALIHAVSLGHREIVHALLGAGARLNQVDENGTSPLMHAAWACRADMVRNLIAAGATVRPQEWRQSLKTSQCKKFMRDIQHLLISTAIAMHRHMELDSGELRNKSRTLPDITLLPSGDAEVIAKSIW